MSNYRTEPQLYQTGGQEPVDGEYVSVTYLRYVHLRSSKSRFQGKVWTGSINLSILSFSMVVKAMGDCM